jgi:SOS response regulatory protein OraA/RecX
MPELSPPSEVRASLIKYAAFCLNRRPYFRETLNQKLILRARKLKFADSKQIITAILDDLQQSGYLNDSYLADAYVRRQLGKGYGPRIISLKLGRLRLDNNTIDISLNNEADTPKQIAAITKYADKYRSMDRRKFVSRLYSRGFSSSIINKVFDAEYIED